MALEVALLSILLQTLFWVFKPVCELASHTQTMGGRRPSERVTAPLERTDSRPIPRNMFQSVSVMEREGVEHDPLAIREKNILSFPFFISLVCLYTRGEGN